MPGFIRLRTKAHVPVQKPKGRMNRTEANYELAILKPLQDRKIVAEWRYEGLKLRLADNTFYTPDFLVICMDGSVELHEVKGTWNAEHQEDARVKIKCAAELFPWFRFTAYDFKAGKREWFGPNGPGEWAIGSTK